jgi:hypothetical protein
MKKIWEKPELVVLVRSNSEEGVLLACKGLGLTRWAWNGYHDGCHQYKLIPGVCQSPCDSISST